MTTLTPLGDRAFLATFADEDAAASWAATVREARLPGVTDVVLAYHTVGVHGDPEAVDLDRLGERLAGLNATPVEARPGRLVTIPVLYDGVDLEEVSARLGLSVEDVIAEHFREDYRVFALGFRPGFAYAGYLPQRLRGLARRDSPRLRVPAWSVAIVGKQTSVYPDVSPGGWHLIGRTPLVMVDVARGFFPIRAGDRIRFSPIGADEYMGRLGEPLSS